MARAEHAVLGHRQHQWQHAGGAGEQVPGHSHQVRFVPRPPFFVCVHVGLAVCVTSGSMQQVEQENKFLVTVMCV